MKIIRVVHSLQLESEGDYFGMYELSRMQIREGDSVRIYTWSRSEAPSISNPEGGLTVVKLRGVNLRVPALFREYPLLPSLVREVNTTRGDIIHAHSHLFLTTFQAGLAAGEAGIPLVVTVHGVSAERGFPANLLQTAYLRTFGASVFRMAARVVCVSHGDVEEVAASGCLRDKIRVVPNAVDSQFFRPRGAERRNDEVLWVGRFVPEKGVSLLLWAIKSIATRRSVKLRLVGDGPGLGRIEGLTERLGLSDHVIFQGRVGKGDVARLMSEASVFALPSIKEGLPKVLLQALASELGVVASAIPGVMDVVKDGEDGLLFQKGDVRGLTVALLAMLNEPSLARRLGRNGRNKVAKNFTWEKTLKGLNRVYEEACRAA